jgi:hypothetical protein
MQIKNNKLLPIYHLDKDKDLQPLKLSPKDNKKEAGLSYKIVTWLLVGCPLLKKFVKNLIWKTLIKTSDFG